MHLAKLFFTRPMPSLMSIVTKRQDPRAYLRGSWCTD